MPGNIQSIERAAAILRLLSGRTRRLSVGDMAAELGLPKATAYGILRTLQSVGFVEQDAETGRYQLGAALLHMGSSYLDGNELRTRALNWADSLAARAGESVRIGTLHNGEVLIVHHVFRPDGSRQALDVGSLQPAHAGALGKALLAFGGLGIGIGSLEHEPLAQYTPATITDPDRLREELDAIRARGWAMDRQELVDGEVGYAAPIQDRRAMTVGAIGVSGPVERLSEDGEARADLIAYVREAARAVSRELGALRW